MTTEYINITGDDLTGADGAKDRTYDIGDSAVNENTILLFVQGAVQYLGATYDYTTASGVITFLGEVYDADLIKGIPIASISETKHLKGADRTALLKKIKDKGITRKEIRATSSILKNSSSVLKKAVLNDDIDFKKAEKIKSLSEEKQKIIIANIKSTRE